MFKKRLSIAVSAAMMAGAMAASSATYAAAEPTTANNGDLALVPYYTAREGYVTGVHITNTSGSTQVVKYRLREGENSADALDFIIVLSPYDMWTGAVTRDANEKLVVYTDDNSCTVPAAEPQAVGSFIYPKNQDGSNSAGAGDLEGYIEIIAMGQTVNEDATANPLAYYALHDADGMPNNCEKVRENFEAPRVDTDLDTATGVFAHDVTMSTQVEYQFGLPIHQNRATSYEDAEDPLRVSWFIRDQDSGFEVGNTAVHIKGFAEEPMMANQEYGLADAASTPALPAVFYQAGYDFPDLDGGAAANGGPTDLFNSLRDVSVLGATSILNDWSVNPNNGVNTAWTVTFPGQYLLSDKDIPVTAAHTVFDREEGVAPITGLVVSPNGIEGNEIELTRESNIVEWFIDDSEDAILSSNTPYIFVDTDPSDNFSPQHGWARFDLTSSGAAPSLADVVNQGGSPRAVGGFPGGVIANNRGFFNQPDVYDVEGVTATTTPATSTAPLVDLGIPTIGGVIFKRSFGDSAKNYGRYASHTTNVTDGDEVQ